MITLIVPCCGRNFINGQPRWTLQIPNNGALVSFCLSKLKTIKYDRIIVTILKEDLDYFSNIKNTLSDKIEFCILDSMTNGPAETVCLTIEKMNVMGEVHIKDIDIVFDNTIDCRGNFISGIHLVNYDSDIKNIKNKSFITRNEQNVVMDIIEKTIKSDIISIGLYGFANSCDFVSAYYRLKASFGDNSTLYISHVISYLIGVKGIVFNYVEIPNYTSFETSNDYDKNIRSMGCYIIDLSKVDVDNYISELFGLSMNGAKLVFLVDNTEKIEYLKKNNIKFEYIYIQKNIYKKYVSSTDEFKDVLLNAK